MYNTETKKKWYFKIILSSQKIMVGSNLMTRFFLEFLNSRRLFEDMTWMCLPKIFEKANLIHTEDKLLKSVWPSLDLVLFGKKCCKKFNFKNTPTHTWKQSKKKYKLFQALTSSCENWCKQTADLPICITHKKKLAVLLHFDEISTRFLHYLELYFPSDVFSKIMGQL